MFVRCPRTVRGQHICSQLSHRGEYRDRQPLPGPSPLSDLMATRAALRDIFKHLRAQTGFQVLPKRSNKNTGINHFEMVKKCFADVLLFTCDPKQSVMTVEGQSTHHGLILISGMGKQVKNTVPRRKGFLPHTSDRAPMRGALRKDSRPWRRKQKQRSNLQRGPPITCNSYFLKPPIYFTGPITE